MSHQHSVQSVYPSNSALRNYYLESSLPEYIINKQYNIPPIRKTHEFYKNDTFIWNNPYRTSKKNYKYFHQQQQQYRPVQEKIKKQALLDNQKIKSQRINLLNTLRQQDRKRIKTRKYERERLESSVYGSIRIETSESNGCGFKSFRKKQKVYHTQQKDSIANSINYQTRRIVQSVMLRQRQNRQQQLKTRRAQIQQLMKKSGQTMKMNRHQFEGRKSQRKLVL